MKIECRGLNDDSIEVEGLREFRCEGFENPIDGSRAFTRIRVENVPNSIRVEEDNFLAILFEPGFEKKVTNRDGLLAPKRLRGVEEFHERENGFGVEVELLLSNECVYFTIREGFENRQLSKRRFEDIVLLELVIYFSDIHLLPQSSMISSSSGSSSGSKSEALSSFARICFI